MTLSKAFAYISFLYLILISSNTYAFDFNNPEYVNSYGLSYNSIAMDQYDRPHIFHFSPSNGPHFGLNHSWYDGSSWQNELISDGGGTFDLMSWQGQITLLYQAGNHLKLTIFGPTVFGSETVSSGSAKHPSLHVNQQGQLVATYARRIGEQYKIFKNTRLASHQWIESLVVDQFSDGTPIQTIRDVQYLSQNDREYYLINAQPTLEEWRLELFVFDSLNGSLIAGQTIEAGSVSVYEQWHTQNEIPLDNGVFLNEIAMATQGDRITIFYGKRGIFGSTNLWSIDLDQNGLSSNGGPKIISFENGSGAHISVTQDSNQNIYVAHYKSEGTQPAAVVLTHNRSGDWQSEVFEEENLSFFGTLPVGIALDSREQIHISFTNTNRELFHLGEANRGSSSTPHTLPGEFSKTSVSFTAFSQGSQVELVTDVMGRRLRGDEIRRTAVVKVRFKGPDQKVYYQSYSPKGQLTHQQVDQLVQVSRH